MKLPRLLLATIVLWIATSKAQDTPPPLFASVTRKDQTVVVTLKAQLMLREGGGDILGRVVYAGQAFTLKDGQWIRFFDYQGHILYDVQARLSITPPDLHIRTTTGPGVQEPVPAIGTTAVRVSSIPIE